MTNKIKQNIVFSFVLLSISALGMIPNKSYADSRTCNRDGCIYTSTVNYSQLSSPTPVDVRQTENPEPVINSINPNSSNIGIGTKTITIMGEGFVSNSVARINGSNRPTTFIDSSHLLIQITGDDTYKYLNNGGFFITVFNSAPGGGYSNTAFFTINISSSTASSKTASNGNKVNDTGTNFVDTIPSGSETENFNNLASNAIFGSNGVYPSGLVQWIFFAILILLVVILVRKVYGAGEKYHATPLKHD